MYYLLSYLGHFLLQIRIYISTVEKIFAAKKSAVILFCGNVFLQIVKKPAKIAKIRTRENLMPHGIHRAAEQHNKRKGF